MKLDAIKFGLACAAGLSILWVVCSLIVMAMPMNMMQVAGDMIHSDLSSMRWSMGFYGLITGLVGWAIVAGFTGWLIAFIYNQLL